MSSTEQLDHVVSTQEGLDETAQEKRLISDAPFEDAVSSCSNESAVAMENDASEEKWTDPQRANDISCLLRCWRVLNFGEIPSSGDLRELFGFISSERAANLLSDHPNLKQMIHKRSRCDDEKMKERERLCRYQLLSEIVNGDWHSLERLVDLREPVRKRAEWDLRLIKLRPFQELIRHQVAQQSVNIESPLLTAGLPVNASLLTHTHRIHSDSVPPGISSVENARIVEKCAKHLGKKPVSEQMIRTRLDCVIDQLPKHYLNKKKLWRHAKAAVKQVACDTSKCMEAIVAKKDAIVERERKERMKLLKENDFGAYLELVKQSKNARIKELLNQTDRFLEGVSLKLLEQQRDTIRARDAQRRIASGQQIQGSAGSVQGVHVGQQSITKPQESSSLTSSSTGLYRSLLDQEQSESIEQPNCLVGGTLMPYQLAGLQFLVNLYSSDLSGILADEMGLGKTIQTIALLAHLKEVKGLEGPHLIIVPLSTLPNWMSEFEKWCPSLTVIQFRGTKPERRELAHNVKRGLFNVCVTTYDWIIREKGTLSVPYWTFIIVDEGHRMKNVRSKFHVTLSEFESTHRLLLTGTPIQNNLSELWSLLNFLLPKIFTSAADFELWFEEPFKDFPGQESVAELTEEEKFLIINRLHAVLRPFLLRRVKLDVLGDLPEKREYVIRVQLSMWQKFAYDQLTKKALKIRTSDGKVSLRTFANVMMQLRKIVNHPYLFENEYYINENIWRVSGKFEVLDRMLPKILHFKHKVLIFCQMTQLMDILDDYLELKGIKRCRLDGSTVLDDRRDRMANFNDPLSDTYVFTLSTRAGGLGLNLQAADTVIIFDSDWNPHQDLQAQSRAHRLGQKNEVRVFRLVTVSPIEELVLSKAQYKLDIDEKIIQAGMFNNRCTEEERQQKLRMLLYSKDMEKETRVTTPQELNRFMARTEEEEDFFQSFDESLFGAEAFKAFEENCCVVTKLQEKVRDPENAKSSSPSSSSRAVQQPDVVDADSAVNVTDSSTLSSWQASRPVRRKQGRPRGPQSKGGLDPIGKDRRNKESKHKPLFDSAPVPTALNNSDDIGVPSIEDNTATKEDSTLSALSNTATDVVTEESLLIKSNRLMSVDEVPPEWQTVDDEVDDSSSGCHTSELQRSARRGRTMNDSKVNADTLSETAFLRALNRLESGETHDLQSALIIEKTKVESRRSNRVGGARKRSKKQSNDDDEELESPSQLGEEDVEVLKKRKRRKDNNEEGSDDIQHENPTGDVESQQASEEGDDEVVVQRPLKKSRKRKQSDKEKETGDSRQDSPTVEEKSPQVMVGGEVEQPVKISRKRKQPDKERDRDDIQQESPTVEVTSPQARKDADEVEQPVKKSRRRKRLDKEKKSGDILQEPPTVEVKSPQARKDTDEVEQRVKISRKRKQPDKEKDRDDIQQESPTVEVTSPQARKDADEVEQPVKKSRRRKQSEEQKECGTIDGREDTAKQQPIVSPARSLSPSPRSAE